MAVAEKLFLEAITIFIEKFVDNGYAPAKNYLNSLSESAYYSFHISISVLRVSHRD